MVDLDNRPELPEIFPETDVIVEDEEHTFEVSETDTGETAQYRYLLDKAPIGEVQSVKGVDQNGTSRTFSNGVDYTVENKSERIFSDFTFEARENTYLLKYIIDGNTDTVTDSSGNTFTNGTDYRIVEDGGHYGDTLEWISSGDSPENGETFTVAYDVTFPNSVLTWQSSGDNLPKAGSTFYVTYRAESIISRYLDANEVELDKVNDALQEVINNKFVDRASGESLDELGKLFGETIGKRRDRNDVQYRIYLKSIVRSFISRGTVNGIKLAISAATDVPLEDITINEDFTNVEYEVEVVPDTPVAIQLLEEVAEIADPSGVDQVRTRFTVEPETTAINDNFAITEGNKIFDTAVTADSTTVNDNKQERFDTVGIDETTAVNDGKTQTDDEFGATDSAALADENTVVWDNEDWGSLNWSVEHN